MAALSSETIQAACIAVGCRAVLIEGHARESRADLALRLIDRGAVLVADDHSVCVRRGVALHADAAAGTANGLEVRGLGRVALPRAGETEVALLAVLLDAAPRFPEDKRTRSIAGVDVPVLALAAFDPAAPIKIEIALGVFPR